MVARGPLLTEVERRLGDRRLVWAGIRGDDIEPLSDLPQLYASFSIAGNYSNRGNVHSVAYEDMTGVRVDPEIWDIDEQLREPATKEFRHGLLRALASDSALLPYRPSPFLSAVHFARLDGCLNLGLFGAQQSAFEHKPWVESAVRAMDLPRIQWTYIADEEQLKARDVSRHGSVVLRRSRTSGGQGFVHVDSPNALAAAWPAVDEAFVSVAPFIDGGLPINVGATVWQDGTVTVHHPSVQLIGVESCVTREFGYCGNDFGRARDLGDEVINEIEASTVAIGQWLHRNGYLGTFGVDFLEHDGMPLFTEVNPRFQGSTHASCRLSIEAGEACLMLEHVAAWLGMPSPEARPLRELVAGTPDFANVVVHWTGPTSQHTEAFELTDRLRQVDDSVRSDVITPDGIANDPGSAVARFTVRNRVTETGFDLAERLATTIADWQATSRVLNEGGS